jgi:hypothetical protein
MHLQAYRTNSARHCMHFFTPIADMCLSSISPTCSHRSPSLHPSGKDYECALPAADATTPVATIDGYIKLANNDYNSVMNAMATIGPLAINVDASTWHAYESGIFNGCNQVSFTCDGSVSRVAAWSAVLAGGAKLGECCIMRLRADPRGITSFVAQRCVLFVWRHCAYGCILLSCAHCFRRRAPT